MTEIIVAVAACVLLAAVAFAAGFITADRMNQRAAYEQKVALQKQYARLRAGVDADDTGQPYVYAPKRRYQLSPEFIDRFQRNGSATEAVTTA